MRVVLEFMDTVIIPKATKGGNALVEKPLADFMDVVKAACPDLFFQSSAGHPDTFDCEQIQNAYQLLEDIWVRPEGMWSRGVTSKKFWLVLECFMGVARRAELVGAWATGRPACVVCCVVWRVSCVVCSV